MRAGGGVRVGAGDRPAGRDFAVPAIHRVAAVVGWSASRCRSSSARCGSNTSTSRTTGWRITNVEQTSMSVGLGPMFRVDPATTFDQFPVTLETRELIYRVSPTFAELRDEIENGVGATVLQHPSRRRPRPGWTGLPVGRARRDRCDGTAQHLRSISTQRSARSPPRSTAACGDGRLQLRATAQRNRARLAVESPAGADRTTVDGSAQDGRSQRVHCLVAGRGRHGRGSGAVPPDDQRAAGARTEQLLHSSTCPPDQRASGGSIGCSPIVAVVIAAMQACAVGPTIGACRRGR